MFTGLVEDMGAIVRVDRRSDAAILTIAPKSMSTQELELGESVAIDGVCLTVTGTTSNTFTVLAGNETLGCTTAGQLRISSQVNIERALRVGDRLGGHMVSGHIDGVGEVAARRDKGANLEIDVRVGRELMRYVVEKGSVALDGISLTVNHADDYSFAVALIPHTVKETTLGSKSVGTKLNLEVDMIGKYVEKLLGGYAVRGAE